MTSPTYWMSASPTFPGRTFRHYLTTNEHQTNRRSPNAGLASPGHNNVNWIVDQVTTTQQMGTHMDGLNHLRGGRAQLQRPPAGIETLPQVVTRGLCLDVAGRQPRCHRPRRRDLAATVPNLEAHRRLRARFTGLLDAIQCRAGVLENYSYQGGRLGISGVAHQNGTVWFGTDPASSALNLDCRMHELDNVYIADSSFLPASSAVNRR